MTALRKASALRRGISIRLRLTLLYTAILALTLVAFSSILYVAQSRATYDSITANLVHEAEGYVRRQTGPFPAQGGGGPGTEGAPGQPPDGSLPNGTLPGRWMQTRTMTGAIAGRTLDLSAAELPLSASGLKTLQTHGDLFEFGTAEDQPVLVYSLRFTDRTGQTQILQVAFPIAQAQQSLNSLRLILLSGSGLAILLAFLLGWVLSGAALDPIHRITQTARTIGVEHDFSRRVEYDVPGDEVGQLAVTFNDMLAELESTYRQLEESLDSQRRFVADASHELRTPLTTVRGNVELLQRKPPLPASERAEILADTTDEVDRLIRLVNQLLVLARADAGQKLAAQPIEVQQLLEDVARQAKVLAPETCVDCETRADCTAIGDRDAVKQVLLILLDNATRHTLPGTGIQIQAEGLGERVAIRVTDTGPGIAPSILPHIFERFYRGEASRNGHGAGLGLAIAKELVELQGGTIEVASELGRGTTFTVMLPAANGEG
jgi:two-component system, OmpR family, sensor kinase